MAFYGWQDFGDGNFYFMEFEACINKLFSQRGKRTGDLSSVKLTAEKMGLLPLKFKAVHIAGTNGKGTVAGLLSKMLAAANFKTGLFTSPHINTPLERIKVNGKNIEKKAFLSAISVVEKNKVSALNFFETLTLAALYYFSQVKVDYAVIECGIGGLLDSTNIINPVLSIVTSVDLDHCDMLGATLAGIAAQKGGIIKPGVPILCGPLSKQALTPIKKLAKQNNSALYKTEKIANLEQDFYKLKSKFDFDGKSYSSRLMGRALNQNAALAIKSASILALPPSAVCKACKEFTIPSRFEIMKIKNGKYLIKDGAHNPAALKEFIRTYKKSRFRKSANTLIFAASKNHDYKKLCAIVSKEFENIILACPQVGLNIAPELLAQEFIDKKISFLWEVSSFNALDLSGNIIVCGSFYLCGIIP